VPITSGVVSLNLIQVRCTLVSSTNKTDRHDITEILLKVALKTLLPMTSKHLSGPVSFIDFLLEMSLKFAIFFFF
jgi:hypothetical protein